MRGMIVLFVFMLVSPGIILSANEAVNVQGKKFYPLTLNPSSTGGPIQGDVIWFAEVLGPDGATDKGLALEINKADSTKVTVIVDDSVIGEVIVYGQYTSTAGRIVRSIQVVVSRPPGNVMTGILLDLEYEKMAIDDIRIPKIWAQYDNGTKTLMYVQPDQLQITSSNPTSVSVSHNGDLKAVASGSSIITARYNGFTAESKLTVNPQSIFISTKVEPAESGKTDPVVMYYPEGTSATLIATVNPNFKFVSWTYNGQVVSNSPTYTFTVSKEQEFVANFSGQ